MERLFAIRNPLRFRTTHMYDGAKESLKTIAFISFSTGPITLYHHFDMDCRLAHFANGSQNRLYCLPVTHRKGWFGRNSTNPHSDLRKEVVTFSAYFSAVTTIILPMLALIALNSALIFELKKRSQASAKLFDGNSNFSRVQQEQERKVTLTTCLIVGTFILTQGPGLFAPIYMHFKDFFADRRLYDVYIGSIGLQLIGKSLNFVLLCLTSESFRQKLKSAFRRKSSDLTRYVMSKLISQHSQESNTAV